MKRRKPAAPVPQRIIKVGALYRDTTRGVTVTVEDHEIRDGHRTGRIQVCAVDGKTWYPRRWYSCESDLAEIQDALAGLSDAPGGERP